MLRSRYFVFFLSALVLGILAFMVGVVINESTVPTPPATEPRECVAVTIDITTGVQTETPTPCLTDLAGNSGCSSSISFRIEEDGSVTSWCNEEVTK